MKQLKEWLSARSRALAEHEGLFRALAAVHRAANIRRLFLSAESELF